MKFKHVPDERLNLQSSIYNGERWYTTPSNNRYPSVTTVLGAEEKPAIQEWRQAWGEAAAKKETQRCAHRGTMLHKIIEDYLNNKDVTRPQDPLTAKLFSQVKMVLNRINNIALQEAPLYNDQLQLAGCVDCVSDFDGVLSIVDFKSSTNPKTREIVHDYFLQCTAYAIMYSMLYRPVDHIVIVVATEKGLAPQVFQDSIDNYIAPLLRRINMFYNTRTHYEHSKYARTQPGLSNRSVLTSNTRRG